MLRSAPRAEFSLGNISEIISYVEDIPAIWIERK